MKTTGIFIGDEKIAEIEPHSVEVDETKLEIPYTGGTVSIDGVADFNGDVFHVEYYMRRYNSFYFRNADIKIKTTMNDEHKEWFIKNYSYGESMVIEYNG